MGRCLGRCGVWGRGGGSRVARGCGDLWRDGGMEFGGEGFCAGGFGDDAGDSVLEVASAADFFRDGDECWKKDPC